MKERKILTKEEIPGLTYDELIEHIRLSKVNSDEYEGLFQIMKEELILREPTINYSCVKCSHDKFEVREFRASGGGLSAFFDIQSEKYRVICCMRCKYSESYHGRASPGQQTLDFLFGG